MISRIFICSCVFFLALYSLSLQANTLSCPPVDQVLQQRLIKPLQNPHDSEQWNFRSGLFNHQGQSWFIEFGGFYPANISADTALKMGQDDLNHITPSVPSPHPVPIPSHILCDYMSEGGQFWLSALTTATIDTSFDYTH